MRLFRSAHLLLLALMVSVVPASMHAQFALSVNFAPPELPVYEQPPCPQPNLLWTPGYWSYADGGYFWVPGAWVLAPEPGYLWTPAWWGWEGGFYRFHAGYWGLHVGFYGGINYGFGYFGVGFFGGEWRGGHFFYNTAYARFGVGFHPANVYVHNVTIANHSTVSFNGHGGVDAHPNAQEQAAMHESHLPPTTSQTSHQSFAAQNRSQFAGNNGGHPGVTAASTPQSYHSNPAHNAGARPPVNRTTPPANTGHTTPPAQNYHPAPAPQSHSAPAPQSHSAPASHSSSPHSSGSDKH